MSRAKKKLDPAAAQRAASSWLTHDGEPLVLDGRGKVKPVPLNKTGALMCRKCGARGDAPRPHNAIGSVRCDGTDWVPYEPSCWEPTKGGAR